jgi:F-type H+/Na+-transporting ATPase subunit alpha
MALNLESEQVGCIIFGDDTSIQQDNSVRALKTLVKTPVELVYLVALLMVLEI